MVKDIRLVSSVLEVDFSDAKSVKARVLLYVKSAKEPDIIMRIVSCVKALESFPMEYVFTVREVDSSLAANVMVQEE